MVKELSDDNLVNGLLWQEDYWNYDVLSWHKSNELGTGVTLTYNFMSYLPAGYFGELSNTGFEVMSNSCLLYTSDAADD